MVFCIDFLKMHLKLNFPLLIDLIVIIFISAIINTNGIDGAKILVLVPISTKSENQMFIPLAKELAARGHTVTFVGSVHANLKMKNFREIVVTKPLDYGDFDSENAKDPIEGRRFEKEHPFIWWATYDFNFLYDLCRNVYELPEFQALYRESFDLILMSSGLNNCFDGLVWKFQAPLVLMSSFPVGGNLAEITGLRMPSSFVPNPLMNFTDQMTFGERMSNGIFVWLFDMITRFSIAPASEEIYRHYLGQDYPSMMEIERNVSLVLSNSHVAVTTVRPLFPNIVEVGGLHLRSPEPLPKDLESFVSGAKDGFIYFSFGTVVKGSTLPEKTRKMFINVFSRLKQRVIWKWETDTMPDLPSNVRLGTWLPQQDILGHKNIKLFISHGGLFSTLETAYHGVPMLGIPFFVDQDVNIKQAVSKGFAKSLEILELTEDSLESAIQKMIQDKEYTNNVRKTSKIFKDQPLSSLDTAMFWIEYVLRHDGAHHLKSPARNLSLIQYYSIDVLLVLLAISFLSIYLPYRIVRFCCCRKKLASSKNGSAANSKSNSKSSKKKTQ